MYGACMFGLTAMYVNGEHEEINSKTVKVA